MPREKSCGEREAETCRRSLTGIQAAPNHCMNVITSCGQGNNPPGMLGGTCAQTPGWEQSCSHWTKCEPQNSQSLDRGLRKVLPGGEGGWTISQGLQASLVPPSKSQKQNQKDQTISKEHNPIPEQGSKVLTKI